MTTYAAEKAAISRTPITKVELDLDYCQNTFGTAPCTATGTPRCYNTFPTCKDKPHFTRGTKTYKLTSADAPLPFGSGERPYLKAVKYLPCEIKDSLTVNARITCEFHDEPDNDVGIDPYVTTRTSFPNIPGTFWRKLLARNPNYKGRQVRVYEGFAGVPEGEYVQMWVGTIDNITRSGDSVKVEVIDLLKNLDKIEIPPKLDIKLIANIDVSNTSMTLNTVEGLADSGYVRIGDEIIKYDTRNVGQNALQACTRGYFDTTAAAHNNNSKVQPVRYYPPANPFDILKEMLLTDAEIAAGYVDSTTFDAVRDWPGGEIQFTAIISEPTKLGKLYFEIVDLLDCKSWVAENLKVTIARNLPNDPERTYLTLSDEQSIIDNSGSIDLNDKSRITRLLLYWDKSTLGKIDDVNEYNRLDIALDADAEGVNEYNETIEKKQFCRWIRSGLIQEEVLAEYILVTLARQLFRQRDARPLVAVDVELKDSGLLTGAFVRMDSDEMVNTDGTALAGQGFQIVKREMKGNKVSLKLAALPPERLGFIAPDTAADYDAATAVEKEYAYITDDTGLIDGAPGYYIY